MQQFSFWLPRYAKTLEIHAKVNAVRARYGVPDPSPASRSGSVTLVISALTRMFVARTIRTYGVNLAVH